MIKIIALTGKAGAGKTTAAKYLFEKHKYRRLRFADGIKNMLKLGLGISDEYIDGNKKEEPCSELGGVTVRHAMRTLGTEWGRDMIYPNIWVDALDRELHNYISECEFSKFVIDDLRFVNEATYLDKLKKEKGYAVLIVDIDRTNSAVEESKHVSETQRNNIEPDHIIFNNYGIETLYDSVDAVMAMYFDIFEGEKQ